MKKEFEILQCGMIRPCYTYKEDDDHEDTWIDDQNAEYNLYNDVDKDTGLIDGKKWWMISPYKPKGSVVTKENEKELLSWRVSDSYDGSDIDKEWNFKEHKVK